MPKYINPNYLSGGNFVVRDNGRVFKRTGNTVTKSFAYAARAPKDSVTSLVIESPEVDKVMYISTCNAAEFGEVALPVGGSVAVPSAQSEFQLNFAGENHTDTGTLVLDTGTTCSVFLSVNSINNLVFDQLGNGSGPHEFTSLPSTIVYTDCNNVTWDITLAALGSFILTAKKTGIQPARCHGTYSSAHSLALSGDLGHNHSVDACFTSSCPAYYDTIHHYHGYVAGGNGADIYGTDGHVNFTLSLIYNDTTNSGFINTAEFEAHTGATITGDQAGLSAHSFTISGAPATASLYKQTSPGVMDPTWNYQFSIPCAGCGGPNNVLSLVLAISGASSTPINWSTGLDAAGNQALYCINFTGDDWKWTLGKYIP